MVKKTLFLRNFKKKFEVNGELYVILNPILEIKGLRKLRHLRKKKLLQVEHRMGNKVMFLDLILSMKKYVVAKSI